METQNAHVLRKLMEGEHLSSRDAVLTYGIQDLPKRISELRQQGHKIESYREDGKNRHGRNTHWYVYWMPHSWHELDFVPVKRRVRFTKRGTAYTDKKTREEMRMIAQSYDGPCFDGPLAVLVNVYKPTPKGIRKAIPFTTRPDADNVLKALLDGLNGIAFNDDAQVVLATVIKRDRLPGGRTGISYEIREIGGA